MRFITEMRGKIECQGSVLHKQIFSVQLSAKIANPNELLKLSGNNLTTFSNFNSNRENEVSLGEEGLVLLQAGRGEPATI